MARILFAWELGKGFGHLAPYLDLVAALKKHGHEVVFAARDVGHTEQIFGRHGVRIWQAPIMMHNVPDGHRISWNYAQLIHNTGFGEQVSLLAMVRAWRHIYDQVQPDLTIFDHSPTALLAARGYPWKRIASGSGFLIPPPGQPLPLMRYWKKPDHERLAADEQVVLNNINATCQAVGIRPLDRVWDLFDVDAEFLLGFEEMDHYPQRSGGRYLGMFSPPGHGIAPPWPRGHTRRVFAYLHRYKTLGELMKLLSIGRFGTVIYAPEIPPALRKGVNPAHVRFSDEPIDIAQAAPQCDFIITNATFGTTAAALLCGTPVLCIPSNLERLMVARRVIDMGAGVGVEQHKPERLKSAMQSLFREDRYKAAAQRFRQKYGHLDQAWQTAQMLETIQRLTGTRAAQPAPVA